MLVSVFTYYVKLLIFSSRAQIGTIEIYFKRNVSQCWTHIYWWIFKWRPIVYIWILFWLCIMNWVLISFFYD